MPRRRAVLAACPGIRDLDRLTGAGPPAPRVGIRWQVSAGCAAQGLCLGMVFLCDPATAGAWRQEDPDNISLSDLPAALAFGAAIFPTIAGLIPSHGGLSIRVALDTVGASSPACPVMTPTWLSVYTLVLVWSAIRPADYFTWFLEVVPALAGLLVLLLTRRRFPLTGLAYALVLVHCIILMVGGHYTYAKVPLFDWLSTAFDLGRNNYDKVGHFVQGFVPALLAREILIRNAVVNGRAWLAFLVVCFCLAFSAFYELVEWWVALLSRDAAESFLGTQGYVWDTQSDMGWALLGAVLSLLVLSRYHDRQLRAFIERGAHV